ncbi:MAG: Lamin Tail Domain, partial [Verrucomicrobiales bacterium]|nr:Lamin Tail Domain [Verrucomicrobiales bacterium]
AKAVGAGTDLIINEWLANAAPGEEDWLELYNREALPVALTGFYLTTSNQIYQITSPTFVSAGGYIRLWADEKPGADHLDFKLSSNGDGITIYDPTTRLVDHVSFGAQTEGSSQGRYPDGSDQIKVLPEATPGASNLPLLKFKEIIFGPSGEFHARVTGPAGVNYTLQTSTNLHDWTDLQSYPAPNGSAEVSDTRAKDEPAHFYRVVIP